MSLTKITNKSLAPLTVLNANIAENTINGSKLAASTVTRDKLASDALDSNPIGTVIYYAGNTAPTGYLIANGSILDRTVYADLFAAIGTLHNTGSESATQFRIPDLRGEFIRGWDQGKGVDPNRVFGSFEDYATARPKKFDHTQRLAQPEFSNNFNAANAPHLAGFVRVSRVGEAVTPGSVDSVGSGNEIDIFNVLDGDEETRPRNVALLPCIKFSNGAMLSQNAIDVQSLAATKLNITGGTITGSLVTSQNPKFYVVNGPAQSTTGATATVIQFSIIQHNIGNGFNLTTNRFTAPVTGYYQFIFNAMCGAANFFRFILYKNGVPTEPQFFAANQTYENFGGNWQVYLNVGDYVDLRFGHVATEVNNLHISFRAFSGFLIP